MPIKFAIGFARLYNQWIADYCKTGNGRLRGVAVTPIEHGAVAIDIMREAKRLGLVATMVPPTPPPMMTMRSMVVLPVSGASRPR